MIKPATLPFIDRADFEELLAAAEKAANTGKRKRFVAEMKNRLTLPYWEPTWRQRDALARIVNRR